jgi:hypothetical protein
MTRVKDIALGTIIGSVVTGAVVAASATTTTMDPVKLSPQYYTVRLDNARVRVLEFRLKPGQRKSCTVTRRASCSHLPTLP